jgi:hypothetical protein
MTILVKTGNTPAFLEGAIPTSWQASPKTPASTEAEVDGIHMSICLIRKNEVIDDYIAITFQAENRSKTKFIRLHDVQGGVAAKNCVVKVTDDLGNEYGLPGMFFDHNAGQPAMKPGSRGIFMVSAYRPLAAAKRLTIELPSLVYSSNKTCKLTVPIKYEQIKSKAGQAFTVLYVSDPCRAEVDKLLPGGQGQQDW